MKKILTLVILIIACSAVAIGAESNNCHKECQRQKDDGGRRAQINAMKMGFFAEQLEMSEEQTAKFWPIYMNASAARRKIHSKKRELIKVMRSKKATKEIVLQFIEFDAELAELDKATVEEYATVLSDNQIGQIFVAEEDFKSFLLHSFTKDGQSKDGEPRVKALSAYGAVVE